MQSLTIRDAYSVCMFDLRGVEYLETTVVCPAPPRALRTHCALHCVHSRNGHMRQQYLFRDIHLSFRMHVSAYAKYPNFRRGTYVLSGRWKPVVQYKYHLRLNVRTKLSTERGFA